MHLFFTPKMAFRNFAILSLLSIYLLILAGGIVRSTGSGMGCPDWPKCFGRFIPPTKVEELPLHYEVIYQDKLHGEVEFNATKTWIEYINRLIGALSGLPVLALAVVAVARSRKNWGNSILSVGVLILLLFEAWLGKMVVDGNLVPNQITIHMMGSVAIVLLLLALRARNTKAPAP